MTSVQARSRSAAVGRHDAAHAHVDVVVVGGGPAGIAATVRAADARRTVALLDEQPNAGGQIWRHRTRDSLDIEARQWLDRLSRVRAERHHGVAVVDVIQEAGGFTIVAERHAGGSLTVRTRAIVLATGARERFLPFPGWTLPGVVGIGGAQALLKQGATFTRKRVVIAGTGPLMLPVAASMVGAGARLTLVAEQTRFSAVRDFAMSLLAHPDTLLKAAMYRLGFARSSYALGTWVTAANGNDRVTSVTVTNGHSTREVACDVLCTGYGLVPNVEMAHLIGCAMSGGAVQVNDRQETTVPGVFAAGEVTGIGGVALALVEGESAGAIASGATRVDSALVRRRAALRDMALRLERTFTVRPEIRSLARDDTIVCRCEDVRRASLSALADSRQAKLYTRAGMGACQGRVCGPALECLFGWTPGTVRSPVEPARVSTLMTAASVQSPIAHAATSSSSGE